MFEVSKIKLTIITICVTIILAGCKNGNLNINVQDDINNTSLKSGDVFDIFSGDKSGENKDISEGKNLHEIKEEVYKYNESGKIIIVMYHKFADVETDEYSRSFENFRKDLEYLYELGYRTISLNDYLENNIKIPVRMYSNCTYV